MRLFLAIPIDTHAQQQIQKAFAPVQRDYPQFRWVPPSNYHVTLHFFGEVEDEKTLIKPIEELVFDISEFPLFSLHGGVFIGKNISVYFKLYRTKQLKTLVERINGRFAQNIYPTREYIPHITIARTHIPSKQQYYHMKKKIEQIEDEVRFPVDHIALYQSIAHSPFPEYHIVHTFPLYSSKNGV